MATAVIRVNEFITLRLPDLEGARDAKGRFTSAQTRMRDRNRQAAVALQELVVRNVESSITRGAASTGRLARVTADPKNTTYDTFRFGVGVESFLNASIAKYWRTFEEGSAGLWRHAFTGTQLFPVGRPPYPVGHTVDDEPGIRTISASVPWMDGRRFVVKHEIAPRHAYLKAAEEFDAGRVMVTNAERFLQDVLGREIG